MLDFLKDSEYYYDPVPEIIAETLGGRVFESIDALIESQDERAFGVAAILPADVAARVDALPASTQSAVALYCDGRYHFVELRGKRGSWSENEVFTRSADKEGDFALAHNEYGGALVVYADGSCLSGSFGLVSDNRFYVA